VKVLQEARNVAALIVAIRNQHTNEEFEVEVDDNANVDQVIQDLCKELDVPRPDINRHVLKYELVHNGVMLIGKQTLQQAGVQNQDVLYFFGECRFS
jgi:uncharacterized ubiquitin-like protein YukD